MRVLVLSFPEFVVDVERAWQQLPDTTPVIVGGRAEGPGVVVAACRLARAAGVSRGMPLVEAARLCEDACFVPGVLDRYAEAASLLDEEVRRSCDAVAWRAIDEAVITDADLRADGGPLARAADDIRARVCATQRISVAAGLADSEVTARIAARLAAPSGLVQVLPGYDRRFLAPLAIDLLRDLSGAALGRLRHAGVTTLGELAALDPARAESLVGPRVRDVQLAAAGVDGSGARATRVPRSLTRAMRTPAVTSLDDLRMSVEAVAEQVADRLVQSTLCARTITVRVVGPDDRFRSRSLTLPEAISGRLAIGPVARTLAAQLWRYGSLPTRVSVVASNLTADGPQLTLFGGTGAARDEGRPDHRAWRTRDSFRALARRPPRAS
jgi:DNA polymerase-4